MGPSASSRSARRSRSKSKLSKAGASSSAKPKRRRVRANWRRRDRDRAGGRDAGFASPSTATEAVLSTWGSKLTEAADDTRRAPLRPESRGITRSVEASFRDRGNKPVFQCIVRHENGLCLSSDAQRHRLGLL